MVVVDFAGLALLAGAVLNLADVADVADVFAVRRLLFHRGDFVGGQEATSWASGSSHGVVVSRLVKVRLAALGSQTELLLELLARNSTLEDSVELFGVNVERGFLLVGAGNHLWGGVVRLDRRSGHGSTDGGSSDVAHHGLSTLDTGASNMAHTALAGHLHL